MLIDAAYVKEGVIHFSCHFVKTLDRECGT